MKSGSFGRFLSSSRLLLYMHFIFFFLMPSLVPLLCEHAHVRLWHVCANWTAAEDYSCFWLFRSEGRSCWRQLLMLAELQGDEQRMHWFYGASTNSSVGKFAAADWTHSTFPARITPQNMNIVTNHLRPGKMLEFQSRIFSPSEEKIIIQAILVINIHHLSSSPPLMASFLMS